MSQWVRFKRDRAQVQAPGSAMRDGKLTLVVTVALALLATPVAAEAQQAGKLYRIGVLSPSPPVIRLAGLLRQSLRDQGYVEGLNLTIEWRDAEGKAERFDDLAAELVRLKVDVIRAGRCLCSQEGDDLDSDRHGEHS